MPSLSRQPSGICKVYEVGIVDQRPYIAMEFVAGQTLDRAVAALGLIDKLRIIKDVAEAIHAAHELGIIHRDIKPSELAPRSNRR